METLCDYSSLLSLQYTFNAGGEEEQSGRSETQPGLCLGKQTASLSRSAENSAAFLTF